MTRRWVWTMAAAAIGCASATDSEGVLVDRQGLVGAPTWTSPVPLSPAALDGRLRYNFGKALAVDGAGVLHAVWVAVEQELNMIEVRGRVYYQRSGDGGRTWTSPRPLTPTYARVGYPKVAAYGPYVYVSWHDDHEGGQYPYLRVSKDHGDGFGPAKRVSNVPGGLPAIAAYGTGVHVVWTSSDPATGAAEVITRSSPDSGDTWLPERMPSSVDPEGRTLQGDGISSWTPVIAAYGTHVYVAWTDERHNRDASGAPFDCAAGQVGTVEDDGCREEIYFRRSATFGQTWGPEVRLTFGVPAIGNNAASLDVDASGVHVAWFSKPAAVNAIFYARSEDDGVSFENPLVLADALPSSRPSVAARGGQVDVAFWGIEAGVGAHLFHARSRDGGRAFSRSALVTTGNHFTIDPQMAIGPDGAGHITYADAASAGSPKRRVYYTRTTP